SALSPYRRVLFSRRCRTHHAGARRGRPACVRAWRAAQRRRRAFSPAHRRAAAAERHLGRPFREHQAARRIRVSARASRRADRPTEECAAMMRRLTVLALVLVAIGAGAGWYFYFGHKQAPDQYQGWVEADFIFVSPDEMGRVD